jgi:hypothetical protein
VVSHLYTYLSPFCRNQARSNQYIFQVIYFHRKLREGKGIDGKMCGEIVGRRLQCLSVC